MGTAPSPSERADELEHRQMDELGERIVVKSLLYNEDIVGRHFRQPPEGLGNDNTPASHMWRTLRRPCNTL